MPPRALSIGHSLYCSWEDPENVSLIERGWRRRAHLTKGVGTDGEHGTVPLKVVRASRSWRRRPLHWYASCSMLGLFQ